MAVLEKIRVKFAVVITALIGIALLSFIIDPNTLQTVTASMSSKYEVGEINGVTISYNEFQQEVDYYSRVSEITGAAQGEQQQAQIQNAAWQSLLDKHMFLKNAKAAGIVIGEDEMIALTSGDMVSPIIARDPAFMDESGVFSKDRLVQFVQGLDSDPSGVARVYWDYLQNTILTQQYYAKYASLFTASNFTNQLMLDNKIEGNNVTANVEFVMVPHGFEADSTVNVSDSEIKDFYKKHKKFYKQTASRDIEYVVFDVKPSVKDIAAAKEKIVSLYDEFASTEKMKSFLLKNSDRRYSEVYLKDGELTSVAKEINDFVFTNGEGTSPVVENGETFLAARVLGSKMLPDSAFVKHILLQGDDVEKADSLVAVLKSNKDNFANVATIFSADQNPNVAERGDIGWMTQAYMIPGMESVFEAKLNDIFVLETQYGTHIVKVTEKTKELKKYQVAVLEKNVSVSDETYSGFYQQANQLAVMSEGKYESFEAAVDSLGLYAHPVNRMPESSNKLGAIENTKEVTRWAFEAKKGEASDMIAIGKDYFFVAVVKEIYKEGYTPVKNVSMSIKQTLYAQKLAAKKAENVAEKIKGLNDMEAIAQALETTVSTKEGLAFESLTAQGLDPKFIGAVAGAEEGKISAPVAGSIGTYVFKVTGRETGAFFTEDDAKNRDMQISQYSMQLLIPSMMEECEVKDNRARFF